MSIIDIGTGSGCIPIALKKQLPRASLTAVDTSPQALQTALANARLNNAEVEFKQLDFLDQNQWQQLGKFDIIVSNPPYIKKSEAASMRKNVLDYEPALALFVPNEDPLVFYRYLADFGLTHSKEQGMLFAEINEALGEEVVHLFQQKGYIHVELKKDMQGKDRMVKAMVPMRFS
jgi:release factor glutamine methyltransferase